MFSNFLTLPFGLGQVYDLSQDAISPQYYFLLPSGKVRDATFVFGEDSRHLVLMASTGFLYVQTMEEQSSATHGPFYITNVLDVRHSDIKVRFSIIYCLSKATFKLIMLYHTIKDIL